MDAHKFWTILDSCRNGSSDTRVDSLRTRLLTLQASQIQDFQRTYEDQIRLCSRWDLVAAASLIQGHISDDSFRYFCDWLISKGSATFESAIRDPDALSDIDISEPTDLEEFGYAATEAYAAKGAGELERDFSLEFEPFQDEELEDAELIDRLPKLVSKYGG